MKKIRPHAALLALVAIAIAAGFSIAQENKIQKFADVQLEGNVIPHHQVVITSPLEGKLENLLVQEGDVVQQGAIIAKMDDKLQAVSLRRAQFIAKNRSKLKKSKLAVTEYQIRYEQVIQAKNLNAAKEWEVREKKAQFEQAKLQAQEALDEIEIAKIDLKLEEEKLKRYTIRAPFRGRIFRIGVEKGQTLKPNQDLIVLYAIDQLKAEINLPGQLFGLLKEGQSYWLKPTDTLNNADGKPMPKRIKAILKTADRQLDGGSFTYRCLFMIQNTDEKLPAGFSIRLIWPQPKP